MMNERIEQLALQAGLISSEHNGFDPTFLTMSQKKFAELIVRECAKTVEVYIHDSLYNGLYERGFNDGRNASALLIKEHFGVEE